jgi:acyl-CoA-binding protein
MPETPLASILDKFRKKSVKPESSKKPELAKSELHLTPEEDTRLKGYLVEAKKLEQSGNQSAALKLYALYKQEFLIIKNKGKETSKTSPEYIEALSEVFKGEALDEITMPKPEDLTDEYFAKMYPIKQREEDTSRGLVSYRPSWWNEAVNKDTVGPAVETWGQAYARSMESEAEQFKNSIILSESIQKPNYKDGSQQYGTKEGDDADADPLLPLIKEVFGEKANRFNLSWDEITTKLIPKVKEKIQDAFVGRHLSVPNFEVILTPTLISNRQMSEQRPENSQTNTCEWTSTILLKQDGTDSGNRLLSGYSEYGGAGFVLRIPRGDRWNRGGFRLSVVSDK